MTPEQQLKYEEEIKKITSDVLAKVKEAEETDSPLSEIKVKRMVADMAYNLELANVGRRAAEFEKSQQISDEQLEESFKDINTMDPKSRKKTQEMRLSQGEKHLSRKFSSDLAARIEDFKVKNDDAYLVATMLYLAEKKENPSADFKQIYKETDSYKLVQDTLKKDTDLSKALAVATSGSGAEWIPTGFSSQVSNVIELQLRIASLFTSISMPTNPYTLPVQSSTGTGYFVPENTADEGTKAPASTPGTTNATFTARKFMGRVVFSEEITEDSIIEMRGWVTQEMGKMIARAEETALINGDRTGAAGLASAHQDNQTADLFTSNWDARLAHDGLRYFALNNAGTSTKTFSNADPSDALLGNVRQLMGKYGVNPSDLVWIVSINTYLKMVMLTNARTIDKYGPQATVLSGELMKYDGIPVVISENLYSNLNASGVYDGSTVDRAEMLLVYRPGFLRGTRGGVTLNSELDIERDQIKLVGKKRVDFLDHYDALLAANIMCVAGINVKTT